MKEKKRSKLGKFLLGVFVGSAVGSIVGITFAPKSGRELRGKIAKNSRKTWNDIKKVVEKKEEKKNIWHYLNKIFFRKKKNDGH